MPSPDERGEMQIRGKVMPKAVIASSCDAVMLSAFGCGAFKNPPTEVARRPHNPAGHFKVFYELLDTNVR